MGEIIHELTDMRHLKWSKIRHESGMTESFLKSYGCIDGRKIHYKLSEYRRGQGIIGLECVNEIIAGRLLDILGIEHLDYSLIHALVILEGREEETYLCASFDYKGYGEQGIALEKYYDDNRIIGEAPYDFCVRMGWRRYVSEMLVADYLMMNQDRHGANMEVLVNDEEGTVRLAPLYDHGLSFACHCYDGSDFTEEADVDNLRIESFVGGTSSWDNLMMVPVDEMRKVKRLRESDEKRIMEGLDNILSKEHREMIWNMLWRRYKTWDEIRAKKL